MQSMIRNTWLAAMEGSDAILSEADKAPPSERNGAWYTPCTDQRATADERLDILLKKEENNESMALASFSRFISDMIKCLFTP
jgi:hypothetical protein